MLTTIRGVFKDGRVELLESAPSLKEAQVIVTFLPDGRALDLRDAGIDASQAGDLRARLGTFAEDWNRPEMDVYDAQ